MGDQNLLLIALTVFSGIIPVFMWKVEAQNKICNTKNPVFLIHGKAKITQRAIGKK